MGVPKFYRYISERYPCLSEIVKEYQTPDFDNFYLDMNGLIHTCSHPPDLDPYLVLSEEKIFASIFHYLEVLFNMIKPRKLFFMAVDGVAPRAKMNQQRARRFSSAKEVELAEKKLLSQGQKPLPKNRFDISSITPGTVFMDRLHAQLKYFVTSKLSSDPLWQGCQIILSGHQTPGEGEHKIMDYIRYLRAQPNYDANTRHCLYGLDADLIMLGLCTHEPHFSLLREKVDYRKKNNRILSPDETEFHLLHLSLMREYLDLEFQELKEGLPFEYDLEKIIDDWILMSFLVGNDFIPTLPDLHINKRALPKLYRAYKKVLPALDGYLNENGYLNLSRFQRYMEILADHDMETFQETYANLAFLEEKTGKNSFLEKIEKSNNDVNKKSELEELIKATDEMFLESDEEFLEDDGDTFLFEFHQHKRNYYTNKLDYPKMTDEVLRSQAEGYIRAIQWNLLYYYRGCKSWSWFYPHHYSPYVSDITNFKDLKLDFEMGEPFLPFQQLLAVLPAASQNLLPEPYRCLMSSPNSPIKDFYPEDFKTDLNGKLQEWEAVVLIPFINEERLLKAMEPCNDSLTPEERRRNQHGAMTIYTYTEKDLGLYRSPGYFPSVPANHASAKEVYPADIAVEESKLRFGLRPGVLLDVLYPGFPTLKHIPHTAALKRVKVKVFNYHSSEDSMVLTLKNSGCSSAENLAGSLLGKIIYVNWPHLVESRVVAIADKENRVFLTNDERVEKETMTKATMLQWSGVCQSIAEHYMNRLAIDVGPTSVLVYAATLEGRKYTFGPMGKITNEKMWSSLVKPYALQTTVKDVPVTENRSKPYLDLVDVFPVGSVVFMLGQPYFGCKGRVLESPDYPKYGRLNVAVEFVDDPPIDDRILRSRSKVSYLPCRIAALKVGINPRLLSRITGAVLIEMSSDGGSSEAGSKINIGLNLKFNKKNLELPGYTKKENDVWLYSAKAVDVVSEYVKKFSRVVEYLSRNLNNTSFLPMKDVFPDPNGITEMKEILEWINAQEYNKVEKIESGTLMLDDETVSELEKLVDNFDRKCFKRTIQVKPHLLYKSDLVFGNLAPVKSARHFLLDRVVSIRSSYSVPTGLRGFIIGIRKAASEADYMYDVLFDEPFAGATRLSSTESRIFRMLRASFINLSDANRCSQAKNSNKIVSGISARVPMPAFDQTNGESKTSAFAQWNQPKASRENDDRFKQMWSDLHLQTAKPQEGTDALKRILKIDRKDKPEIEDPVKSFFEKVSRIPQDADSKNGEILLDEGNKSKKQNCYKYYNQLFSYYQRKHLGQPRFNYLYVGGKITAQIYFNDGRVYSGLPCHDKESACESASLQVLGALGEILLKNEALVRTDKEKKIRENQVKLSNALEKSQASGPDPVPAFRAENHRQNDIPHALPDPPSRWVGSGRLPEPRSNYDFQEGLGSRKLSVSALGFVPLQAIVGKRNVAGFPRGQNSGVASTGKLPAETGKKTEPKILKPKNTSATSTGLHSTEKRRRRPKIAAKLALDPNLY